MRVKPARSASPEDIRLNSVEAWVQREPYFPSTKNRSLLSTPISKPNAFLADSMKNTAILDN